MLIKMSGRAPLITVRGIPGIFARGGMVNIGCAAGNSAASLPETDDGASCMWLPKKKKSLASIYSSATGNLTRFFWSLSETLFLTRKRGPRLYPRKNDARQSGRLSRHNDGGWKG